MTRSADLVHDTWPPPPHRYRIILGNESIKKVLLIGKIDPVFHGRTDYPVTLYDVSFVPDPGFNLFSLHVVQEKREISLNKTGTHLLDDRLVFPRRCSGSSLRATRVLPGRNANASTALATFAEPPSHRSDVLPSPLRNSSVAFPVAHQNKLGVSSSYRPNNAVAGTSEQSLRVPWGMGRKSESMSSGNGGMAVGVLSLGDVFKKKKKKWVDINHFHVSPAYAHSSVLKATAKQHDIQLVGELAPCSGCLMAVTPMDMVHIDTAEPFQESLVGSRYVVMFVDSDSRLQRPYGARDKNSSTILGVVKRFVTDMGVPRAFRTDSGAEHTNSTFVDYCNGFGPPRTNGPIYASAE